MQTEEWYIPLRRLDKQQRYLVEKKAEQKPLYPEIKCGDILTCFNYGSKTCDLTIFNEKFGGKKEIQQTFSVIKNIVLLQNLFRNYFS